MSPDASTRTRCFAAVHESVSGTFRKCCSAFSTSAYDAEADIVRTTFHNIRLANNRCNSKAKMSALSKVGMSVFYLLVVRFGGYGSDECGADEQARAESD
jgi:hypothetical protein